MGAHPPHKAIAGFLTINTALSKNATVVQTDSSAANHNSNPLDWTLILLNLTSAYHTFVKSHKSLSWQMKCQKRKMC